MITDIPWSHREVQYDYRGGTTPIVIVEGDIDHLDGMFTDLPNYHQHETHSTRESINRRLAESRHGDEDEEDRFYQALSYEDARDRATVTGRNDVTKLVTQYLADDQMREEVYMAGRRATRPVVRYGDEGDELDFDRLGQGEDDVAWRRMERIEASRRSRIVVIDVNVIVHAGAKQKEFAWNGVQAVVLVDALEAEGFRVEVNVLQVLSIDEAKFASRVRVKRAQDPLRIDLLAYQTGCVALTRSALWRCMHAAKQRIPCYGWNDVSPAEVRAMAHFAAAEDRKPDHVLPIALNKAQALERIREVIATYRPVDA